MSCSTNLYDCSWEPSGIFAVIDFRDMGRIEKVPMVELEICVRCRLLRLPRREDQTRLVAKIS